MTRQDIIDFCLTFPAAYEDYPFEALAEGNRWTAMRHRANKKTFAFINIHNHRLCVNLKCDPMEADFLRQAYTDIIAGFHMNKTHWNSIFVGGDVPDEDLRRMIENSYDLVKPKQRGR
jgi:predicted DNA-binding protein (MmcQ/YjbR family)